MPKITPAKISQTQAFKALLANGYKMQSWTKEGKTFKVTIKKIYQRGKNVFEDIRNFFVGYWALPKTIKTKKVLRRDSKNRGGTPKAARMAYA